MSGVDVYGFAGIVLLAVVVGMMAGMRIARWAEDRGGQRIREKQAFIHLSNPKFLV